ncbi:MAG: carbohydrate-binding family 9-like protein [Bacteroidota bacterium]
MNSGKEILLYENKWFQLDEEHFFHATDGSKADQITKVKLKKEGSDLRIDFECLDNPFVNENHYLEHNSAMWNQEVFEIFIEKGAEIPKRYLEIEINPNDALFVGWIDNPTGSAPAKCDFLETNLSGISHQVEKNQKSWRGFLNIPLILIGSLSNIYRINFFRIVSTKSHSNKDWKCTLSDADFTCLSPTFSGADPKFHIPKAFVKLRIEE